VTGLVEFALGPLTGAECRRALGRRWIRAFQVGASVPGLVIVCATLWFWWFAQSFDATYRPGGLLRGAVITLEGLLLVVALVLSPAMVAGALAGEKARGILPLLLASNVSAREIATGRLAGRLVFSALFAVAALPAICFLAGYAGLPIVVVLLLAVLPISVSFGAGGLALLASALSRRGRDALLSVYLAELILCVAIVGASSTLPPGAWAVLGAINPFFGLVSLVVSADLLDSTLCVLFWTFLGLVGLGLASWQLRRVYLRQVGGERVTQDRRQKVKPIVGDDPMLWKEIYFERVGRFSRFVWWTGLLTFTVLFGASFVLLGLIVWSRWILPNPTLEQQGVVYLQEWVGATSLPLSWLIQWTMALRAAVAVAGEREQGTWEPLLLSSLEGREIIRAKIWGNLYSLRGFIVAAALIWTGAALVGAMDLPMYLTRLANTVVFSVFITAAGVWLSLTSATATRGMTMTIGAWLTAAACFAVIALLFVSVVALTILILWVYWTVLTQGVLFGGGRITGPPVFISFSTGWALTRLALYAAAALLIAIYCRYRFDSLAGRAP
jgi:ABC-type Na+ efflux pump permease subunit